MNHEPESPDLDRRKLVATALLGVAALAAATRSSGSEAAPADINHDFVDDPTSLAKLRQALKDLPPDPVVGGTGGGPKAVAMPEARVAATRTAEGAETWAALQPKIAKMLPAAARPETALRATDGLVVGGDEANFFRLGRTFNFAPLSVDQDLNPLHPEFLLDQAADLLDRSLRDRAAWDEMNAKQFQLALELNEYRDLDAIHQKEIEAGVYTIPATEAAAEAEGLGRHLASAQVAAELTRKILAEFYGEETVARYAAKSSLLSRLGAMPAYYFKEQKFSKFNKVKVDGQDKAVYEHAEQAAGFVADINVRTEKLGLLIQQSLNQAAADYTDSKQKGAVARADWEAKNALFGSQRTAVSRRYQDAKAVAAVAPWGPVNYQEQMAALQKRFEYDFREALARLRVAADGMGQVYGYQDPLPVPDQGYDYYDECLLWARRAVQFLIRRGRAESNAIMPVSVRALLPGSGWSAFKSSRTTVVKLTEAQLPGMAEVRLRGFSATFRAGETGGLTQLTVQADPPPVAVFRPLGAEIRSYPQPRVRPCVVGRVFEQRGPRLSDTVGVQTLFNASPFGDWRITVAPGSDLSALQDMVLEFHVAYRPLP